MKMMNMHLSKLIRKNLLTFILLLTINVSYASYILIPMDDTQTNHLKAYGITFLAIEKEINVNWLLNYKGGSFLIKSNSIID
jgi:hypothetical protein